MSQSLLVLSDLDGCLLDHHTYSYAPAVPLLERLRAASIPVVLCSSKTEAEMRPLAEEMEASPTIICENGGVICWEKDGERTVLGVDRQQILDVLTDCKSRFQFESFRDLGVEGIARVTGLPEDRAERAASRHCTEPLLWHDDDSRIEGFRTALTSHGLQLTRGGRFWHVAGPTDKGKAAAVVIDRHRAERDDELISIGLGDSPIDESLLLASDIAVVIPAFDGSVRLEFPHRRRIVAPQPGPDGWASSMSSLLDEYDIR
ncbi:HAD-IIB family hydrolase [Rubinisphaera margarita]|uniref:HAD-IIB family hydrolase n=1 Tax=Rubinisphaera margarita TaxID=2909586 RepID=UPI001EE78C39|nr:HAD-IIB family hydrolase [Rubinisphaera margarita]MCG6154399.1 HAD-IIB family hydrolase [Rubinisphaera margarita]